MTDFIMTRPAKRVSTRAIANGSDLDPLSHWERVRVRAYADFPLVESARRSHAIKIKKYFALDPHPDPLPKGEGVKRYQYSRPHELASDMPLMSDLVLINHSGKQTILISDWSQ